MNNEARPFTKDKEYLRSLFQLRDDVVFLNHGSFGACPRPVFEHYQEWQRELERQPVLFIARRLKGLMEHVRQRIGDFVGTEKENLVCIPNATTGVSIVAGSLPLTPGDEILTTDHEYGACVRAVGHVCQHRGATLRTVPVPLPVSRGKAIIESLMNAVNDRTRALFISHCSSSTAIIFPIAEIVARCKERQILTIIDGAHGPGHLPLDLSILQPDFYIANCHKWLMSPKGSGFLYAAPHVQNMVKPAVISWGDHTGTPFPGHWIDEIEYQGTDDPAAYLSIPAAIDFQKTHDWESVRHACHDLLRDARRRMVMIPGFEAVTSDDPAWYGQMAAFLMPEDRDEQLQRDLYDQFTIEIPVTEWRDKKLLRISIQGYNTPKDVDSLFDSLMKLGVGL